MLHSRNKRIGEAIRQSLSHLFQFGMKDPRLPPIVTVTHVEVGKDLRHARVYYSQMPDDPEALEQMAELLEDSHGFIRSQVAHDINVKFCPDLAFRYDPSAKDFQRINTLLHRIEDERESRRAANSGED